MYRRIWTVHCLVGTVFAIGCGGKTPPPIVAAEGTIQIQNKPVKNAEVRFIPADEFGPEYIGKGVTDENGRFTLSTNGMPGACACDCYVVVLEAEIPARLRGESPQVQAELERYLQLLGNRPLPKKYGNIAETPLRVTVTAERKDYVFDLTRD
jgi:hypothetical protein